MRLFWTWFARWLAPPAPSTSIQKSHPDLNPLDVRELVKDLELRTEAARLGKLGLPGRDATVPTGPEASAIQRVERARQDYVDWATLRLQVLSDDSDKLETTDRINRARQAAEEFERKASSLLADRRGELNELSAAARSHQSELNTFRAENKLARTATIHPGHRVFFGYALLAFLVVLEGILNATFFAQGLDSGLIGGASQAMMLAAFNVAVAFLFGKFGLRQLVHVSALRKLGGFLASIIAMATIAGVGLGIAHYRDALTRELPEPPKAALESLLQSPLGLNDVFSWALFLLSLLFALLALVDGIVSDDRYPGYSGVARKARDSQREYDDELGDVRSELEELKDAELANLEETVRDVSATLATFNSRIGDKRTTELRLKTALVDVDNVLHAVLQEFRTENEAHRPSGLPAPAYFTQGPVLRQLQLPSFDTTADEARLAAQRRLYEELLGEQQAVRAKIQAAFTRQLDQLKPLEHHYVAESA